MTRITSVEQLRAIIPAPGERAFAKIRRHLCAQATVFVTGTLAFAVCSG